MSFATDAELFDPDATGPYALCEQHAQWLSTRLAQIQAVIQSEAVAAQAVTVVVASKSASLAWMRCLFMASLKHFGENQVQAFTHKHATLASCLPGAEWHFIGTLQRNKVSKLLATAPSLIHSVDTLPLAHALSRHQVASSANALLPVTLQVNIAQEPQKHGFYADQLEHAALTLTRECPGLLPVGLMTMLPLGLAPAQRLTLFKQVAQLKHQLEQTLGRALPVLSMGMSEDYPEALAAGATHLRLGRVLMPPADA
ncbi:MAG: YggS family pyridoxal phosphate-dependent enzyme [Vampirovibrionales bacterium]|nr:YggS family pyridoxal phosphate-dependent enzyme [Vampirovibrionales bacterium]